MVFQLTGNNQICKPLCFSFFFRNFAVSYILFGPADLPLQGLHQLHMTHANESLKPCCVAECV